MARQLETHNFQGGRHSTKQDKFPLEWLNGEVWECVRGEDFTTNASSFRSTIGEQAKRHGLKIRGNVFSKEVPQRVVFQAYKSESENSDNELDLESQ